MVVAGSIDIKPIKIDLTPQARKITERIGKLCADDIGARSPSRSGKYAKGWRSKMSDPDTATVYQSANKRPGLTHLLEKGHVVMRKGQQVGWSPGKPHIRPAFLKHRNKYLDELKKIKIEPQ